MATYIKFSVSSWKPSEHFINDRIDRYMDIIESKGFGSYFVASCPRNDGCCEYLTNTGILVVLTQKAYNGKQLLVTAYCPNRDKVYAMFQSMGESTVPHWVYERVGEWAWLRKKYGAKY